METITGAVIQYNKTEFASGITRQEAEYYNSKLEVKPFENTQLMTSDDLMTLKIRKENIKSIKQVEIELHSILSLNLGESEKISRIASLIVEGQTETNELLKRGFGGLTLQNSQLLKDNEQLNNRLVNLQEQLEIISNELAERKKQEKIIQDNKIKRKNRKRKPRRDEITIDIYNFLF